MSVALSGISSMTAKSNPSFLLDPEEPRNQAAYLPKEVACYLGIPESTVRVWARGRAHCDERRARYLALISPAKASPLTLSFWNVVEIYVLASMRREHGVSMQKVRRALEYVKHNLNLMRPLIQEEFLTNGVEVFVEHYSELISVTEHGQMAFRDLLVGSLKRIRADQCGLAQTFSPFLQKPDEPTYVEVDPRVAFGRLVIAGTSIPADIVTERFRAGDSIDCLKRDYGLTIMQAEMAIRWGTRVSAA